MTLQALLVTPDEEAAAILGPVLAGFGMSVYTCGYSEAIENLEKAQFNAVIVDFDDRPDAVRVLDKFPGTVAAAILRDRVQIRSAFGAGASFVLSRPLLAAQAEATLRAAVAVIKRERRRSVRVAVQMAVWIRIQNEPEIEGILLDLSENGMEVLSSRPLYTSASIGFHFDLPDNNTVEGRGEIVWANPNGQSGLRFSDLSEHLRNMVRDWVIAHAQNLPEDVEPISHCKLTDLSLGGCYIETESPFPERAGIALGLRAQTMEVEVQGTVRVMHPGFGMGVEFASGTQHQREQVRHFIELLTSKPGTHPRLLVSPISRVSTGGQAAPDPNGLEDPLLNLLRDHAALSQEEFLGELQSQRSAEVSVR